MRDILQRNSWLNFVTSVFRRATNVIKFFYDYLNFRRFLENQNQIHHSKQNDETPLCITVMPWLGSAVPWYSIVIALILYKNGKNIFLLFDDMPFGDDVLFHKIQSSLILKTLKNLQIKLIKLSDYKECKSSQPVEIEHLIKLNSLHYAHGETNKLLRDEYEKITSKQLSDAYAKIVTLYEECKFSQIIVPGGIWGTSGIYTILSKRYDVQLTSYDSDDGELWMSLFGIAAQLKDIPHAFNKLVEDSSERKLIIEKGQEQLRKRREGRDHTQSHFNKATNVNQFGDDYYLMLLNSVWDTAALGIHTVYESMLDWILDSIDWVLNNTDKTILIRQHPAERGKQINNTDTYKEKIESKFGINKRIIFIEARQDINSYDLIENALCVLGFSSTIIVESVMLGKPAIIISNAYFSNFGIAYNASDKKEYYMYLLKSSKKELKITEEMKNRACISNYLTQTCNLYRTEFTPVRTNFLKWSELSIEDLERDYLPIQAILRNKPLSILQHERISNDA